MLSLSTNVLAEGVCEGRPLRQDMLNIKTQVRDMSVSVKAGDNAEAAKRAEKVIAVFKAARKETPYLFVEKDLKGDELAKQTAKFQGVIDDTIAVFTSLESALEKNDSDKIRELMGKIGKQRHIGHSSFKTDC